IDHWQLFDHRGKKQIDLTNYLHQFDNHILLYKENSQSLHTFPEGIRKVTYENAYEIVEQVEVLYLFDLPPDLNDLRQFITKVKPMCIHACFYVENSAYLSAFPTREDFKWLYSLVWKRKELDIRNELNAIMNAKGWSKESVHFMLNVFSEIGRASCRERRVV